MKGNPEKCHNKKKTSTAVTSDKLNIDVIGAKIASSLEQKLLDVTDGQLLCKSHTQNVEKSQSKFNALTRIPSYMDQKKKKIIMNAFLNGISFFIADIYKSLCMC